jgi:hypothetical protein
MTSAEAITYASYLLGLYAIGFAGGYLLLSYRRFLEQI